MKKAIIILLFASVFTLASCKKNQNQNQNQHEHNDQPQQEPAEDVEKDPSLNEDGLGDDIFTYE